MGSISAVGAVGSLVGVLLYQNAFRTHPFRRILFWAELLYGASGKLHYGASGMLDLILVSRINLQFGLGVIKMISGVPLTEISTGRGRLGVDGRVSGWMIQCVKMYR